LVELATMLRRPSPLVRRPLPGLLKRRWDQTALPWARLRPAGRTRRYTPAYHWGAL